MKQHIYAIEDSDISTILSEFSISDDELPKMVISALYGEQPEIFNPAFKAVISPSLHVVYGHTRRFRRLEIAIHRSLVNWLSSQ